MKVIRNFPAIGGQGHPKAQNGSAPRPWSEPPLHGRTRSSGGFFGNGQDDGYPTDDFSMSFAAQDRAEWPAADARYERASDTRAPYSDTWADQSPDPYSAPQSQRGRSSGVVQSLGAVLSLALIVGAGAWVWQLMQRDVSGVPVVRALEGPLRVLPENPGGTQVSHQGLSVTQLAAAQEHEPGSDLILAPLSAELQLDDMLPTATLATEDTMPSLLDDADPVLAALQQVNAAPAAAASQPLGINSPTQQAVARSVRPPARGRVVSSVAPATSTAAPAQGSNMADDLAASVASSVVQGLSGQQRLDVDPASIPAGTRLVQLGAYDDIDSAHRAWDLLKQRFSPLLDDKGRVVEAAHSGGSTFFRLRAHGFQDERDARRFCSALADQQVDCIPVLVR